MKPYYEQDGITIYHGDCRDITPQADVMVTDPPYGMGYQSGWKDSSNVSGDDDTTIRDEVLSRWQDRPALVFGRWSCPRPLKVKIVLYWDKGDWPGMGDLTLPWGPSTEEIYVLGAGFVGKRRGQILSVPRRITSGHHPTEKPVELMKELLWSCPEGVILDPFMGSGSTLVAAKELGRRAIGIEIEKKYCEIAVVRLAQGVLSFGDTRIGQKV